MSDIGRIRGGCALWLSGRCRGGGECRCLPTDPAHPDRSPSHTVWRRPQEGGDGGRPEAPLAE